MSLLVSPAKPLFPKFFSPSGYRDCQARDIVIPDVNT